MKNKNKIVLGTTGALVIGLLAGTYLLSGLNRVSLAQTTSSRGQGVGQFRGRPEGVDRSCADEDYVAMQTAIDNKDYATWKELRAKYDEEHVGKGGAQWANLIDSQEKFEKFVDIKNLMDEGKYDEAQVIRQELGFQTGMGQKLGRGKGQSMGRGMHSN